MAAPFYSEAEFIGMLVVGGVTHADHDLVRRIRPVMIERDEAWRVGTGATQPWVYSTMAPVAWVSYFQKRARNIEAGVWTQRRAYQAADVPCLITKETER